MPEAPPAPQLTARGLLVRAGRAGRAADVGRPTEPPGPDRGRPGRGWPRPGRPAVIRRPESPAASGPPGPTGGSGSRRTGRRAMDPDGRIPSTWRSPRCGGQVGVVRLSVGRPPDRSALLRRSGTGGPLLSPSAAARPGGDDGASGTVDRTGRTSAKDPMLDPIREIEADREGPVRVDILRYGLSSDEARLVEAAAADALGLPSRHQAGRPAAVRHPNWACAWPSRPSSRETTGWFCCGSGAKGADTTYETARHGWRVGRRWTDPVRRAHPGGRSSWPASWSWPCTGSTGGSPPPSGAGPRAPPAPPARPGTPGLRPHRLRARFRPIDLSVLVHRPEGRGARTALRRQERGGLPGPGTAEPGDLRVVRPRAGRHPPS